MAQAIKNFLKPAQYSGRNQNFRGLMKFITEIRHCHNKEQEEILVKKQLSHIRDQFAEEGINAYMKKKHLLKLVYIFLLGYNMEIGFKEAINLLASTKPGDKSVGYVYLCTVPITERKFLPEAESCIRSDLESANPVFLVMALQCLSCISELSLLKSHGDLIKNLVFRSNMQPYVSQTAVLCYLALIRIFPEFMPETKEIFPFCQSLLANNDYGLLTSSLSFIEHMVCSKPNLFKDSSPLFIQLLTTLDNDHSIQSQEYSYQKVKAPWLRVKLFKLIQILPIPTDDSSLNQLNRCIMSALSLVDDIKQRPSGTSKHTIYTRVSILFEALNVLTKLVKQNKFMDVLPSLADLFDVLGHTKDQNIKYLFYEYICKIGDIPAFQKTMQGISQSVMSTVINERDSSVIQKLVDVLIILSTTENYNLTVSKMLFIVKNCEYEIKSIMVCKSSALIELYSLQDITRYVTNMLELLSAGGSATPPNLWYKVVHALGSKDIPHQLLTERIFESLNKETVHESVAKLGVYVMGEYGHLISHMPQSTPQIQFKIITRLFSLCEISTKHIIVSTIGKFAYKYPDLQKLITIFLSHRQLSQSTDLELQQRACEYSRLIALNDKRLMETVCEMIPVLEINEQMQVEKNVDKLALYNKSSTWKRDQGKQQQTSQISHCITCEPKNLIKGKGLIFKDNTCLLGYLVNVKYDDSGLVDHVLFTISLGNKCAGTDPITNISVSNTIPKSISSDLNAVCITPLSECMSTVDPERQETIYSLKIQALEVFIEPICMDILYSYKNTRYEINVTLPINMVAFAIGRELPYEKFGETWQNSKQTFTLNWNPKNCHTPIPDSILVDSIKKSKMAVQQFLADHPNIYFCTSYMKFPNGKFALCLMRIVNEFKQPQLTIHVKSTHKNLMSEFVDMITSLVETNSW